MGHYQNIIGLCRRVEIPNNWYKSLRFKVVFDFCSKIKVVKMVFWLYHCVEEEEMNTLVKTTSKLYVEHGCTLPHVPARRLSTRIGAPQACHASSLPRWPNPTRIPEDPTHMTDLDGWWCHHAHLACHVNAQSADTSAYGTHLPHHQSRAELSQAERSWVDL
jgi:hypothetical protein